MAKDKEKKGFTQKEKLAHYTAVAKGEVKTKKGSKFTKKEQQAYARGQRDARNESNRMYKFANSTPAEREEYAKKKQKEREEYKKVQAAKVEKEAKKKRT